jgi:4-oxalocrotonate tautomerase
MPFVNIKLVAGQPEKAKNQIAKATARAIHEATGLPLDGIWVVFEDIPAGEWFLGERSVAAIRAQMPERK